jgi:hypothetical protein
LHGDHIIAIIPRWVDVIQLAGEDFPRHLD